MKKILAVVLAAVMILSMSVCAFAASPTRSGSDGPVYVDGGSKNIPGASNLADPKVTADTGVTVTFNRAGATAVAANEKAAKDAGANIIATVGSTEINVRKGGTAVHSGATVELTVKGLSQYIGKTLLVVEDGEVVKSVQITTSTMVIALTTFSTYSFVVAEAPVKTVKSPATGAASALAVIALVATGCAVVSKKHI